PRAAVFLQTADSRAMSRRAIADDEQRTAETAMHSAKKSDHVGGACIMAQEVVVQAETLCPGSAGERRQGRDAVPTVPGVLHRRLSARSPHAAAEGLQQETALVEKNQASLPFGALFLAAATRRGASGQSPVRCVRGLAVPASADSSRA